MVGCGSESTSGSRVCYKERVKFGSVSENEECSLADVYVWCQDWLTLCGHHTGVRVNLLAETIGHFLAKSPVSENQAGRASGVDA